MTYGHDPLPALRAQLHRLKTDSPFYVRKFAMLDPDRLGRTTTIRDWPMTNLAELRASQTESPPLGAHAATPMTGVRFILSSSGTAAPPHYVGLTARDWDTWVGTASRCFAINGVSEGAVVIDALGFGMFTGGMPVVAALQRLGATVVPVGPGEPQKLVRLAKDCQAHFILCTPSYIIHLLDELPQAEIGIASLRGILLGAEPGGSIPELRRIIEQRMGAPAREALGNADLMPVYAAMCGRSPGNHLVAENSLLLELADPDTGNAIDWRDGAEGELIATHLVRDCTPVVRLRTRDIVHLHLGPCPCGRTAPRLVCLGRVEDAVMIGGRRVLPADIQAVIAGLYPDLTLAFELLHRAGDERLTLRAEYGLDATDIDGLQQRLHASIAERFGILSDITLLPPLALPRYGMKSRRLRRL